MGRPAVLASVANHLLNARTDLQTQRMLIQHAYEIMYRYVNRAPVCVSAAVVVYPQN